ncbi:MAG TPA: hypothetical protein VMV44_14545 [Rectinemataceae bacterium]|nr:hypothetical protein [Rectinemataceae bacterium]
MDISQLYRVAVLQRFVILTCDKAISISTDGRSVFVLPAGTYRLDSPPELLVGSNGNLQVGYCDTLIDDFAGQVTPDVRCRKTASGSWPGGNVRAMDVGMAVGERWALKSLVIQNGSVAGLGSVAVYNESGSTVTVMAVSLGASAYSPPFACDIALRKIVALTDPVLQGVVGVMGAFSFFLEQIE